MPTTPRTDLPPLNTAVHKCSSYCLAVCLYSGATAEDVCGRQCRCEKEMATGTLRQVAKDANVQVRMGHLHRH